MQSNKQPVNIFWFRRDLRIDDNTGLFHALHSDLPVLPIFIFDTEIIDELPQDDARVEFIYNHILKLHSDLGERFLIKKGNPLICIKEVIDKYNVKGIFLNQDYEPYSLERDAKVEEFVNGVGIGFFSYKDQVIFEKQEIVSPSNKPYKVYTPYMKNWMSRYFAHPPKVKSVDLSLGKLIKEKFRMPSLKSLGFRSSGIEIPGNEIREGIINDYKIRRDFPAEKGTSRLGVHLRFGTVSIRKIVALAAAKSEVWLKELIWREFYMMILYNYPKVIKNAFKPQYDKIPWRNDPEDFKKWCDGKTGYPLVDAGMRELNHTGFMHNRVRMVAASFLTKHLLIDWRWGESYFALKLLDYELASNNGGWQWVAGTGTDAQPYFRIFNPESQAAKFDPENEYIRRWIPEISTDKYPKPIVNHKLARERALEVFKKALNG